MGLIFVDCFWAEKFFIETNEYFLGKSNNEFSDIKLVQISDLHLQDLKTLYVKFLYI